MKIHYLLLSILIIGGPVTAQKIFWSDLGPSDRVNALKTSERFFNHLMQVRTDSLKLYLPEDTVNLDGVAWMPTKEFLLQVKNRSWNRTFNKIKIYGYTFEDFLDTYTQNEIIKKVYWIFDNHSFLAHVTFEYEARAGDIYMILQQRSPEDWMVVSIFGLPINFLQQKRVTSGNNFRKEKLAGPDITISLPKDFTGPEFSDNAINFYLEGKTERDAVIQVLTDEIKAKMYFYTYKFVEFTNQNYSISDLIVRYLPYGIMFEYYVVDSFGDLNKGITVGIEKPGKAIIIQFYGYASAYKNIKEDIEYSLQHIEN